MATEWQWPTGLVLYKGLAVARHFWVAIFLGFLLFFFWGWVLADFRNEEND